MPSTLQLYTNRARLKQGTAIFDARLSGATFVRDIGATAERIDPWGTREFSEPRHVSWAIELTAELRPDSLLFWLLDAISVAGTSERGMTVREIRANAPVPGTFDIQFDGIDGVSTFEDAALTRIGISIQAKRAIAMSLGFCALTRTTGQAAWTGTLTESDGPKAATTGRIALATTFNSNPDAYAKTCYETAIEIARQGVEAVDFDADGTPRGHTPGGQWDMAGTLMVPEIAGITDTAVETTWNGSLNLAMSTEAGSRFEIDAPVTGKVTRRTGIAADWKQAAFEFVTRRSTTDSLMRFIRDF